MLARRDVIKGLGMLPLATVLASPSLVQAAVAGLETVQITTGAGQVVSASLALPKATGPAPAIMLIHEWWGLNDQIRAVAAEFAQQGYVALAIDLMKGQVTDVPDQARHQMETVVGDEAGDTTSAWINWLRGHAAVNGKIGTVGWCFGGGWSLNSSILSPVDATVIYYGRVNRPASDLAHLKGPVLGHFAKKDQFINQPMVEGFVAEMAKAEKELSVHWYEADHAFANPTSARYDQGDAALSWERTTKFFADHLKG